MKPKQGLGAFWQELRRRHVVRTGGMYVAAGFVVLQLGEIVLPAFNAPDWVLQSLVVLAFLGLPVVLAFAWAYDLTPEGLAKTSDEERTQGGVAPRLALLAVASVSVALGAIVFTNAYFVNNGVLWQALDPLRMLTALAWAAVAGEGNVAVADGDDAAGGGV